MLYYRSAGVSGAGDGRGAGASHPRPPAVISKQTLNSKGWEFTCPLNFIGGLPESLTQGLLIGKLLVCGLGVLLLLLV